MSDSFAKILDTAINNYAKIACRPEVTRKLGFGISTIFNEAWQDRPIGNKTAQALGVAVCHFLEEVDKAFRQGELS